jgi:hypothetical protein
MAKSKGDLIRIEYVPLSQRQPATRNPKLHALEDIKLSLRRFGFVMPGAINEATGRMVVGHGRGDASGLQPEEGGSTPTPVLNSEAVEEQEPQ